MTPTRTQNSLSQRLRRARIRAGLTQAHAAELAGTSREYLNRVELGAQRSPEVLVKLARALDIDVGVDELFPPGD